MSKVVLDAECRIRERFIDVRLSGPVSEAERKDLTDFFHNGSAELLACSGCGQLLRHELEAPQADAYSDETYDASVMQNQYPRYVAAFRAKEQPYRSLLPQSARILEVGSHYGAFLQTAAEWGWRAEGIDVGRDTSSFARAKGFTVYDCELQDCGFADDSIDGVFIWNCFEQIEDPKPLLTACARILKSNGLLVLRTPNAAFYMLCRRLLDANVLADRERGFLEDALGYNNLLGFPYLYGYDADRLARCAAAHGFATEGMLNSELLTLPLPDEPGWVKREERQINEEAKLIAQWTLAYGSTLAGPWIECWFRLSKSQNTVARYQTE